MDQFLLFKSLHLVFMVSWFAGLFYIVRLFIYQTEAQTMTEPERKIIGGQLALMAWRLWYIIAWPAMVLTLIFGLLMLWIQPSYLLLPFMHIKLGLVALLVLYHVWCHAIFGRLQRGEQRHTSLGLRVLNEVATLLLVAIVFVIVFRDTISFLWGLLGLVGLGVVMMLAIRLYKKARKG